MKRITTLALAAIACSACDARNIAAPNVAATNVQQSTSIQHGDGATESPYYTVEPGEWISTYSFEEADPMYEGMAAPCPPMYRQTLWMWIDIANVGRRRFWFQPPFYKVATIAPGFARYSVVVPGVDERGEWTASGPVIAECRRGLLPGLGMIRLTDHEGQLRRNGIRAEGCDEGGGGGEAEFMSSYDPYSPVPGEDYTSSSCGAFGSTGGNYTCSWDYITLEISRDGGKTWEYFWSGWAQVCVES
jgi:hypothetical protein